MLVATVGRLDPWKGHEVFLEAAAVVLERHPTCVFAVIGDVLFDSVRRRFGDRRQQMERRAKELGVADRVRFLGQRTDVPRLLGAVDVLVHPSREPEPFGRSVAEAMAASVPVVASRIGGIPEIVTDGENGLLVPAGDAAALAEVISKLLGDDSLRARLAAAGRAVARDRFSIEAHVEAVQRVYEELLEPVPATSR